METWILGGIVLVFAALLWVAVEIRRVHALLAPIAESTVVRVASSF